MEEVKDYKNEIANTRVGCLGSSVRCFRKLQR